jgi:PLP dependent protein
MNSLESAIKTNLSVVYEKMQRAAILSKRLLSDIKLVVVSKSQPVEVLEAAYQVGIRIFGENYPEEAILKRDAIHRGDIEWHMIGHIQSRKISMVLDQFTFVHSLDRIDLAAKMNAKAVEQNKIITVLIECNVAGEETKYGWQVNDLEDLNRLANNVLEISKFKNLRIRGLMAMSPLSEDPNQSRKYYRKIRKVQSFLMENVSSVELHELSFGTSFDYEVAIEEGATIVRVGQAVLGPRPI